MGRELVVQLKKRRALLLHAKLSISNLNFHIVELVERRLKIQFNLVENGNFFHHLGYHFLLVDLGVRLSANVVVELLDAELPLLLTSSQEKLVVRRMISDSLELDMRLLGRDHVLAPECHEETLAGCFNFEIVSLAVKVH